MSSYDNASELLQQEESIVPKVLRMHKTVLPDVNPVFGENSPYYTKNGDIYEKPKEKDEKPQFVARLIVIEEIRRNIDNETFTLLLSFNYKNQNINHMLPRQDLNRKGILNLQKYGADIIDDQASLRRLLHYLRYAEQHAILSFSHQQLGFGKLDGKLIYKLYNAIGCSSTYEGTLSMEPKGTLTGWLNAINTYVIGHTPLEFALLMGLSAPVASLLTNITGMDVQFYHIYGDSSMGKSTACALAVSPFGLPNAKGDGLVQTWNATENAILGNLCGMHGVPMVLDEASIKGSGDFSNIIYVIASGKEKSRLDQQASIKQRGTWSGVFISNAEHSLKQNGKKNTGVEMRIMELANIKWTESAAHANQIMQGILQNYGHAALVFVKHLLEIGNEELVELHQQWKEKFIKQLRHPDQFASRIADKAATILVTTQLVKESLKLELHLPEIAKFLTSLVDEGRAERDIGYKAYEYFQDMVTSHLDNFCTELDLQRGYELWGRLVYDKNEKVKEILILPGILKKIMKDGGFESSSVFLRNWRQREWLICDKDKLTAKRDITPELKRSRVYVVKALGAIDRNDSSMNEDDFCQTNQKVS
ncbi:MAG: DUF927 domain-containing protein [Pelosinus sp.]|nr:DUF927 domain-containing protein [Pelosinus sp.]